MVIKSSGRFRCAREKGGIKRNTITRFSGGNWSGLLSFRFPSFARRQRDPPLSSRSARSLSRARFARIRATILLHRVYGNAAVSLHGGRCGYAIRVTPTAQKYNVTDRRNSRHAAHNAVTCAKLWDIFARLFSASTWARQIMMSYCSRYIILAYARVHFAKHTRNTRVTIYATWIWEIARQRLE